MYYIQKTFSFLLCFPMYLSMLQVLALDVQNFGQLSGILVMSDEEYGVYSAPNNDWRCAPADLVGLDNQDWMQVGYDDSDDNVWQVPTSRGELLAYTYNNFSWCAADDSDDSYTYNRITKIEPIAGMHLYPKSTVAQARPSSGTTLAQAESHSRTIFILNITS